MLAMLLAALSCLGAATVPATAAGVETIHVTVNAQAQGKPFPHFWEKMFGSGHSVLALRADYQHDLAMVKRATDFNYVRFHDILGREVGVFHLDKQGRPIYNFSYVDQIYDALLAHGVKPFVELSSMPPNLQADPHAPMIFFYKFRTSPPKSYALWDGLIKAFARHLVERYGIDEVSSWYFEVWNEPNIPFWSGKPAQATYFKLYAHTARDLKSVSPRLRVGGPSTSAAAWIPAFLDYTHAHDVPVDFVSTHAYGNVCPDVKKVHKQILQSQNPQLPLILSEFNAAAFNRPDVTDSAYMGPYLARTIHDCAGDVDMMSFWTFSDVFDEQGVVKTPFYGGFGLIAEDGIPKPAFNAFALLHKLGHTRLPVRGADVIATRRRGGTLALALWNYAPPVNLTAHYVDRVPTGVEQRFDVHIAHLAAGSYATLWRVGRHHADVMRLYDAMGRPAYPTRAQIAELRRAGMLAPPRVLPIHDGRIEMTLPAYGLALLEVHA